MISLNFCQYDKKVFKVATSSTLSTFLTLLTNVSHLDLVGDDGGVVEADGGLPGDEDVGVSHGFDDRAVRAAGNVAENNPNSCGNLWQKLVMRIF